MIEGTIINGLLNNFAGNEFVLGAIILISTMVMFMFVRAFKSFILGMFSLVTFGLYQGAFLPAWVFFVVLTFSGVSIAKSLIQLFFSKG